MKKILIILAIISIGLPAYAHFITLNISNTGRLSYISKDNKILTFDNPKWVIRTAKKGEFFIRGNNKQVPKNFGVRKIIRIFRTYNKIAFYTKSIKNSISRIHKSEIYKHQLIVKKITSSTKDLIKKSNKKAAAGKFINRKFIKKSKAANSQPISHTIQYSKEYTEVPISLKDINRIVAPNKILYVINSKEKSIQVKKIDNSVYIKILPIDKKNTNGTSKLIYGNIPRDVFIVTNNNTYSLILIPRKIPAQTVYLKYHANISNVNNIVLKSSTHINNIINLIKSVYTGNISHGFEKIRSGKLIKKYKQADVILENIYKGIPYSIYEYVIVAKQPIYIKESQFLNIVDSPIAIAIVHHNLSASQATRMFIISEDRNAN